MDRADTKSMQSVEDKEWKVDWNEMVDKQAHSLVIDEWMEVADKGEHSINEDELKGDWIGQVANEADRRIDSPKDSELG